MARASIGNTQRQSNGPLVDPKCFLASRGMPIGFDGDTRALQHNMPVHIKPVGLSGGWVWVWSVGVGVDVGVSVWVWVRVWAR